MLRPLNHTLTRVLGISPILVPSKTKSGCEQSWQNQQEIINKLPTVNWEDNSEPVALILLMSVGEDAC